ncbi:hypothetical protein TeGR_g14798 [Tetraparma gracilis]|uniref:Uncharacterized protein n=1 Tax=Tetraparma gracilis TaxID=2962635 RepID=A0ABQ6N9M5_9STRA|nr:hypothetical protein TeGR_g14798 [Tetraparma gracilis]
MIPLSALLHPPPLPPAPSTLHEVRVAEAAMVLELLQSLDVPLPFTIAISILSLPADVLLESYHIHLTAPSLAPSTSLASEVSAFVATLPDYKFSTTPGVYLRLGLASAPPPATSIPLASTPGLSVVRAPPLLARQTEALEPGQRVFASRDASAAKLTIKTYQAERAGVAYHSTGKVLGLVKDLLPTLAPNDVASILRVHPLVVAEAYEKLAMEAKAEAEAEAEADKIVRGGMRRVYSIVMVPIAVKVQ